MFVYYSTMARVAVSGAHQVGKSTVIRDLLKRLPGAVSIGNILRRMEADGYGIRSHTGPLTLAVYLSRQTADEDRQVSAGHLFSDRVFVDAVAYMQANVEAGISRHPWNAADLRFLQEVARLHASRYELHLYIPVEFAMTAELPTIEGSEHFRRLVDRNVRDLLSDAWPIPVATLSGSRGARIGKVMELIGAESGSPG